MCSTFLSFAIVNTVDAAYSSLGFSPTNGTISTSETKISIVVNSGNEIFTAINAKINFTGPIQFVKSTEVSGSPCKEKPTVITAGQLNFLCTSIQGKKYNGALVDLYFKATDSGTSSFTFGSNPGDGISITNIGSASFTVTGTSTNTSTITNTNSNNNNRLPQTSERKQSYLLIGIILLFIGVIYRPVCVLFDKIIKKRFRN